MVLREIGWLVEKKKDYKRDGKRLMDETEWGS